MYARERVDEELRALSATDDQWFSCCFDCIGVVLIVYAAALHKTENANCYCDLNANAAVVSAALPLPLPLLLRRYILNRFPDMAKNCKTGSPTRKAKNSLRSR